MKNLRVTPKRKSVDTYNTGDHQTYNVYEVRRDWEQEKDGFKNIPTHESVKNAGVVIETFNSKDNAEIFVKAMNELKKDSGNWMVKLDKKEKGVPCKGGYVAWRKVPQGKLFVIMYDRSEAIKKARTFGGKAEQFKGKFDKKQHFLMK